MDKTLFIIHAGPGAVGSAFRSYLASQTQEIQLKRRVTLLYGAVLRSQGTIISRNGVSLPLDISNLSFETIRFEEVLKEAKEAGAVPVFVDTTATEETYNLILAVLQSGGYLVTANKKLLAGPYVQYRSLVSAYPGKVYYETTVGAGLPVISTIQQLLEAGDTITTIQGTLSGTLGFLCSEMEKGSRYADAVRKAQTAGFTEPDPRDDLSGMDVARKTLILSRLLGQRAEMNELRSTPFYNTSQAHKSVDEFLSSLEEDSPAFDSLFQRARQKGMTLRYTVRIDAKGSVIGLTEVPEDSLFGSLEGTDNCIAISSNAYSTQPLIVRGPGAGATVTGLGVMSDLLHIIQSFSS